MIALIVYVVAVFGCSYILGHSVISKRPREWAWDFGSVFPPIRWLVMLVECPACLSFWCGLAVGGFGIWPADYLLVLVPAPALALAFFSAGSSYILGRITGLMPSSYPE